MEVKTIAEQLFFTTVRIETEDAKGEQYVGTSFFFAHRNGDKYATFLVSNKHVVQEATKGKLTFIKAENDHPNLGKGLTIDIDDFEKLWHGHPESDVDIAVAPMKRLLEHLNITDKEIFYRTINSDMVPNNSQLSELDALEEVIFIGYPNGLWDATNFLPIMRKGITATPISVDFGGKKQFLVDASVFNGSSGSPVFVYSTGSYSHKAGGVVLGNRLMLVGVIAEAFYKTEENKIVLSSNPNRKVPVALGQQMIDLGVVFKSATIIEAIQSFLNDAETQPKWG